MTSSDDRSDPLQIRADVENDLDVLREIERAARRFYRRYGLHLAAGDEFTSVEVLSAHAREGRAWVEVGWMGGRSLERRDRLGAVPDALIDGPTRPEGRPHD